MNDYVFILSIGAVAALASVATYVLSGSSLATQIIGTLVGLACGFSLEAQLT